MKRFWLDCLIATVFVFMVLFGIGKISQFDIFNSLDPIGKSLGDMEFTDITISRLREDPPIDTSVVVVNIGNLSRIQLAEQIRIIASCKPKVIGMDSFFICPGGVYDSAVCPQAYDTLTNLIFGNAVQEVKNFVMVTKLMQTDSLITAFGDIDRYDSLQRTDSMLRANAYEGFANLETDATHQEDLKSCRRFNPTAMVRGKQQLAFAVQMCMLFDSVKTKRFLARGRTSEVINYRGNIYDPFGASTFPGRYYTLDWDQAMDTSTFVHSMIKDKIVIMGFLGNDLKDTSWDDKFFTPLNKEYAGKSRPDMYGVVVHANIVSMILTEDYVDEMPAWQQAVLAFVLCFFNVALFAKINKNLPIWFDALTLILQVLQIGLCILAMTYVFKFSNFKLNLTYAMAALALVGTCFEMYNNVVKTGLQSLRDRKWFTNKNDNVLTP